MKSRLFQFGTLALCLLWFGRLCAQDPVLPSSPEQSERLTVRPPDQLDQLFGPIALYPDALIALILPASTVPSDIVLAARYVAGNRDPAKADDETWDDSVKALVHYPDIIKWMDENLAWTKQAGEAFGSQPADVMNSIQRLRARARAAGTLVDTPQQQVVMEDDNISIVPSQPDVIYVPSYDPDVVYISHPGYSDPYLTFGLGYAAGFWLGYDFDWGRHRIWTIDRRDRERYWQEHHDWRQPSFPGRAGYSDEHLHQQPWKPRPNYQRPRPPNNSQRQEVARPVPFPNGGANPRDTQRGGADSRSGDRDHRRDSDNQNPQPNRRPESARTSPETVVPAPATPPSPSTNNNVHSQAVTPTHVPQRLHDERENRPPENAHTSPGNSVPPSAATTPPPPITNARSQPTTPSQTPSRDRENHEVHGRDRREESSVPVAATPQGRVAPVQPAPAPRPQPPAAVQARQQSVETQQSRSDASSQSSKSDKDDRSDRSRQ